LWSTFRVFSGIEIGVRRSDHIFFYQKKPESTMTDIHMFLSKNCKKAEVSAAVTALTMAMQPTSADECTERIFKLVADILYEQQLIEANKSNFIHSQWPAVRTCKDPFAINTPSVSTLCNRRNAVVKVCKHAAIDTTQWPFQLPSAESIANVTRAHYTIESTYKLNYCAWMTFLSACNTSEAEKRIQFEAFQALERHEPAPTKAYIDSVTVTEIRRKLAELHIVCLKDLQEDIASFKQLANCRRYVALATLWGCSTGHQPMRRGDWPTVLLSNTSQHCNYITLGPVVVHMRTASKVGKVHQDTNLSECSPLLAEFLTAYVPVLQRLGATHAFMTVKGKPMRASNVSQHLPQYYRDLDIVLPQNCAGANAVRHAAVTAERRQLGIRKRTTAEADLQREQAAKRLHSATTASNVYGK